MIIKASAEDYLETILVLREKHGKVKSIDIAKHMGFAKPTISIQMKQFRDNGYITQDANKNIALTEKGETIARRIHERHVVLSQLLMMMGVAEQQAFDDACKIEHSVSEETFTCIKNFYESHKSAANTAK